MKHNRSKRCKHRWVIDKLFESGPVMMSVGKIGEVEREDRFVCAKCGPVDYKVRPR